MADEEGGTGEGDLGVTGLRMECFWMIIHFFDV